MISRGRMAGDRHVVVITSHRNGEWDGGDSVITAGLMTLCPSLAAKKLIFSRDVAYENIDSVVGGAQCLIHAGTPSWLCMDNRPFWRAATKHRKKVFMLGIGLAMHYTSEMWYGSEEFVNLRDAGLIERIVCRDKLCYYWLNQRLGFPSDRISVLPCPGFYAAAPSRATDKVGVVVSVGNEEETAHETRYTFRGYHEKTSYLVGELEKSGAVVHLMYQRPLGGAFREQLRKHYGDRPVHSFTSCRAFCDFIQSRDVYVGVRNHGALPCAGAGKPSLLLGTDYRQHLADEIPFLSRIDISHASWEPREVLDWYHALEPASIAASLLNYRRSTAERWTAVLRACEI